MGPVAFALIFGIVSNLHLSPGNIAALEQEPGAICCNAVMKWHSAPCIHAGIVSSSQPMAVGGAVASRKAQKDVMLMDDQGLSDTGTEVSGPRFRIFIAKVLRGMGDEARC
jgi:hypothetical protein